MSVFGGLSPIPAGQSIDLEQGNTGNYAGYEAFADFDGNGTVEEWEFNLFKAFDTAQASGNGDGIIDADEYERLNQFLIAADTHATGAGDGVLSQSEYVIYSALDVNFDGNINAEDGNVDISDITSQLEGLISQYSGLLNNGGLTDLEEVRLKASINEVKDQLSLFGVISQGFASNLNNATGLITQIAATDVSSQIRRLSQNAQSNAPR